MYMAQMRRIPLNTLAIGFGLAGLAGTWTAADRLLGVASVVPDALWLLDAVVLAGLLTLHALRGRRAAQTLVDQLRDPAQRPLGALVPVVMMFLGARLQPFAPRVADAIVVFSVAVAAGYAGWVLAGWAVGRLPMASIHGGHLLPTVAAGLVGANALAQVGHPHAATAAFAVGIFFWVVVGTLLLVRITMGSALPDPLVPTLAIVLAPPVVAGNSWFSMHGMRDDAAIGALAGLSVLMFVMQVALVPVYRRLPFTMGFWSFTFPVAAAGTFAIQLLSIERPIGWQVWSWIAVGGVTALIAAIAVRTIADIVPSHDGRSSNRATSPVRAEA
jgi:tellurite resistance protein